MTTEELLQQARDLVNKKRKRSGIKKRFLVKKVQYFQRGNFTTVVLNEVFAGMSKCNPASDVFNKDIGLEIALNYAANEMLQK